MRLLIVSNRLPVTLFRNNKNEFGTVSSAGGLVSGLKDYLDSLKNSGSEPNEYLWIGWPGISINPEQQPFIIKNILNDYNLSPVFFSEDLMNNVYNGFCNKTIWPLFHYFPGYAVFNREFWDDYKRVNEIFCEELLKIIRKDDIIWIHDYHLMLLPQLLREKVNNPLGFFLHIPFPAYEVYNILPEESRQGILKGLLGADLIGFHTHQYSQYFLRSVLNLLGLENHMGQIDLPERSVKVGTYPLGVDYEKFNKSEHHTPLPASLIDKNQKIILSVDRLDYSKGIINRLKGFELFLQKQPQWHGKACLNMIVVPSRKEVESYKLIKSKLEGWVGYINGKYGKYDWIPVVYRYISLPQEELISLYRMSDVALLTPLRDGMNLVAKEYIASRNDKKGVLILSEFTGASKDLSESLRVNPNSIEEIADAIEKALNIPENEQMLKIEAMQERLRKYNNEKWANGFVEALKNIRNVTGYKPGEKIVNDAVLSEISHNFKNASSRMIILNYDRTIIPVKDYVNFPGPSAEIIDLLKEILELSGTELVLLSGRSKEDLDRWLDDFPAHLSAEHGSWIKEKGSDKWTRLKPLSGDWKNSILPVLEIYTDRLPGSRIIEKDFSLHWNYYKSNNERSALIAKELTDHLISITANLDIQVCHGNKIIEISNSGMNKGDLATHWINNCNCDFLLAVGEDRTDEILYQALPENAYSIKIGKTRTDARYLIEDQDEFKNLLKELKNTKVLV